MRDRNSFTLYGDPISGNCLKPKFAADLLGIPFTWKTIDVLKAESRTPEFLALSPAGQVPVATWPDGRVLSQSNAILLYIAEGSALIPEDGFARAQMHQWLFWEQYSHETAIAVRRFHKHYLKKSEAEIDPALLPKCDKVLSLMQQHLSQHDFFVAGRLSAADIALVAYTRFAHEAGLDLKEWPAVARWVVRTETALGIAHAKEFA
jgi:glutathione S-transferase